MILPYQTVKQRCETENLIFPYIGRSKAFGMSYGLSSAGYDVRVAQSDEIPSGGFMLVSTIEKFNIPNDLLAQVCDKSTWARQGLAVQNTIIEPGWCGYLTLELTNHNKSVIQIKYGMPICQIIFFQLSEPTTIPYSGKYQDQSPKPVTALFEED